MGNQKWTIQRNWKHMVHMIHKINMLIECRNYLYIYLSVLNRIHVYVFQIILNYLLYFFFIHVFSYVYMTLTQTDRYLYTQLTAVERWNVKLSVNTHHYNILYFKKCVYLWNDDIRKLSFPLKCIFFLWNIDIRKLSRFLKTPLE